MKLSITRGALSAAGVALAVAAAPGLSQGRALAKVGAEEIHREALFTHLRTYYGKRGVTELVRRSQIAQECLRAGIKVADAAVDARATEVKKALKIPFADALALEGISEATWKERLRTEVMVEKLGDAKWPVKPDDLTRLTVRYCRTQSVSQARTVILDAKNGVNFENLVRINSMDRENGGLIQPERFFKIDNPRFFRLATTANLRVGQVTPKPIEEGGFQLVVKLESVYPPETLSTTERANHIKRLKAVRMTGMPKSLDARFKVAYPTDAATLAATPPPAAAAVVATVTPTTPRAPSKAESFTVADLERYLVLNYGKAALDQLIERTWIAQDARKAGVSVTDADVDARLTELTRGGTSKDLENALTATEGISLAAWKVRMRYTLLAERIVNKRVPVRDEDLERVTVSYILTPNEQAAGGVLAALNAGQAWNQVRQARGLNKKEENAFVLPKILLSVDNPDVFKAVAGAEPGQIVEKPLTVPAGVAILRLDARFGADTISARERESATRRLNATRMQGELDKYRKGYKIEYGVPLSTLAADVK